MSPINHRIRGKVGEDLAAKFLERNGLKIIQRNYRFERGEIDIIAEEREVLVFVEVKARRSQAFGEPHEAVTARKQQQIRKVAEGYLFLHEINDKECRFDIVAIHYAGSKISIEHFENAF
jgi:putative endonuclease